MTPFLWKLAVMITGLLIGVAIIVIAMRAPVGRDAKKPELPPKEPDDGPPPAA